MPVPLELLHEFLAEEEGQIGVAEGVPAMKVLTYG